MRRVESLPGPLWTRRRPSARVGNLFELTPGGLGVFPLRRCFLRALSGRGQLSPGGFRFFLGTANTLFQFADSRLVFAVRGFGEFPLCFLFLRALTGSCQIAPGGFRFVLGATNVLFQFATGGGVEFPLRRLFLRAACDLFQGLFGRGGIFQRTVGNLFELTPGGLGVFPLRRFVLRALRGRCQLTPGGFASSWARRARSSRSRMAASCSRYVVSASSR